MPPGKVTDRLSDMENHLPRETDASPHGPDHAARILGDLAADRATLAGRMAAPAWLYPAFGALAAAYVASPAITSTTASRVVVGLAMASTILLVAAYQRLSGVRASRVGAPARLTLVMNVVALLVLLSVSLGLASFDLRWWIALPSAASLALTVILGRVFDRQYREAVRLGP